MIYDTNLTPYSDSPLTELKLQQKQATSPIIFSSKKSGYILEILGDAGVAAGELEKLKRVYGEFVKQNQYVEIRVRIPEVHSYLDPLNIAQHDCICIALKGDYLKVGAPVQASFENPVDTTRGYILNSQTVAGNRSQSKPSKPDDFSDPDDTATKKDNKPVYVDKGFLGLPFKCEVRGELKGLRQRLIEDAKEIAEAAGWYYGATKKSTLRVQTGLSDHSDNHKTGNAMDFEIVIDNKHLGRMESYAFVATMIAFDKLSSKRMGLYLDPKWYDKTKGVVGYYNGSFPHYDLRRKGGSQRWVRFYKKPSDTEWTESKAGKANIDDFIKGDINKEIYLKIPKSVRLRVRQLYHGNYYPYSSINPKNGTVATGVADPYVAAFELEIKKQKDSWKAWKDTPAGKSFEDPNEDVDLVTTQASFAWKLSKGGPLGNFDESPDKNAMGQVVNQILAGIANLHFNSKKYETQKLNEKIKLGLVGALPDKKKLFVRPYPTRVTIIPVYVEQQKKYFEYWSRPDRLPKPDAGANQREIQRRREQLKQFPDPARGPLVPKL